MHRFALLLLFALGPGRAGAQVPLTLETATDRDFYAADAAHNVYLEMKLSADAVRSAASAPAPVRNVALVLDRSGSMAGERMLALRDAVTAALPLLRVDDIISIITFGSEVETVVTARPRGEVAGVDALLAAVAPEGGSALYDALNQGAAQLRRHATATTSNHLILVTDGPPTKAPRDLADFTRLAAALADEHITISTLGLGDEFNEDMLAALARAGNGHFRYVAQPGGLTAALQAELALPGALVARDVTLVVEILSPGKELESFGWVAASVKEPVVTYRLPYFFAGQETTMLLGGKMEARRGTYRFARLSLGWTDVSDGQQHAFESIATVRLDADSTLLRKSANPVVVRTAVAAVISEGLQNAIEQIDKGDFRRALRELRRARSDAFDLNFRVDDPAAAASIQRLEAYLAEVQGRGLNQLDRKVLRSGLFNQFSIPVAEEPAEP